MSIKNAFVTLIFCTAGCGSESYFDRMVSDFYLTLQLKPLSSDIRANKISPEKVHMIMRRLELISDTGAKVVLYDRQIDYLTATDAISGLMQPDSEKFVLRGAVNSGNLSIGYAKLYLDAAVFGLRLTNFNASQLVQGEEQFLVAYNSVLIDDTPFAAGDTGAMNHQTGRIEFFDLAQATQAPLSIAPTTKYSLIGTLAADGQDDEGFYRIVPVTGVHLSDDRALRIRIVLDASHIFGWTDVLSGAGTFDAASQDIFNWYPEFATLGVEINEL
ncbi:MAG: hypothetical protein ACOY5B_10515 [Spirochaetota bacterium]